VASVVVSGLLFEGVEVNFQGVELLLLSGKVIPQSANFTSVSGIFQFLALLSTSLRVALVFVDLLFQAENFKDHGVGTVENQGEEKSETTEIHVTLRVKLSGLNFHTLVADDCRSARH
jgi:hypothetical protein